MFRGSGSACPFRRRYLSALSVFLLSASSACPGKFPYRPVTRSDMGSGFCIFCKVMVPV